MTRAVRHVGIVVKKIDDVLPFYRDLLGFRVVKRADEPVEFVSQLLGRRRCRLVTVKLSAGEGKTLIELLEFALSPNVPAESLGLDIPGISHIALTVGDLDQIYRKLSRADTPFTTPPLTSPDGKVKVTFCQDPAGTWLELVEELA